MNFAHYSDEAAALAADLVNTKGWVSGKEFLTEASLKDFLIQHDMDGKWRVGKGDLEPVRAIRERLRSAFDARDEEECAATLNSLLEHAGARPYVTNHDGSWHIHYVPAGASLADHLAVVGSMGVASVVSHFGFDRLGVCSADDCLDVYIDTSRNKSRRYCAESCSSRTNVAAYRNRHKKSSTSA
jgi:predicted RNA-binding Zn ribbon-like protein